MSNTIKPASGIMRDFIILDVIPELKRRGGQERFIELLNEAIELGERCYGEYPEYWEGIRIFAQTQLDITEPMDGE